MNAIELEKQVINGSYHVSHTSLMRGYVSRKNKDGIVSDYKGRFGVGYKVITPNFASTRYCFVTYYIVQLRKQDN